MMMMMIIKKKKEENIKKATLTATSFPFISYITQTNPTNHDTHLHIKSFYQRSTRPSPSGRTMISYKAI